MDFGGVRFFALLLSVVSKAEQNPEPGRAVEGAIPLPCPYLAQHEVKSPCGFQRAEVFSCSMLALLVFGGRVTATGRVQLSVERVSPCVVGFAWGFFGLGFSLPHLQHPWEMWVKALELRGVGFFWGRTAHSRERPCISTVGFCVD